MLLFRKLHLDVMHPCRLDLRDVTPAHFQPKPVDHRLRRVLADSFRAKWDGIGLDGALRIRKRLDVRQIAVFEMPFKRLLEDGRRLESSRIVIRFDVAAPRWIEYGHKLPLIC